MKEAYVFDYINENDFKKIERSLKKYNMLAYKKLYFEYVGNIEKFVEFTLKIYTSIFFGRTKRSKNTGSSETRKLDTVCAQ